MPVTFAPAQTIHPLLAQGMQQSIDNQQRGYGLQLQAAHQQNMADMESARMGQQAYQFEASQQPSARDQWQHQADMIRSRQQAETQDEISGRALSREEQLRQSRLNNAYGQIDNLLANNDITAEQARGMRYRVSTGVEPLNRQEEAHRRSMQEQQLASLTLQNQTHTVMNQQNAQIAAGNPARMRTYHDGMLAQFMAQERANDPTASDEQLTQRAQARTAQAGGMRSMVMTRPGHFEEEVYPFQLQGASASRAPGVVEPGQQLPNISGRPAPGRTSGTSGTGGGQPRTVHDDLRDIELEMQGNRHAPNQMPGPNAAQADWDRYYAAEGQRGRRRLEIYNSRTNPNANTAAPPVRSQAYQPFRVDERGNVTENTDMTDQQRGYERLFERYGRDIAQLGSTPGGAQRATQLQGALATIQRHLRAHGSEAAVANDPAALTQYTRARDLLRQRALEVEEGRQPAGQAVPPQEERPGVPLGQAWNQQGLIPALAERFVSGAGRLLEAGQARTERLNAEAAARRRPATRFFRGLIGPVQD